jgi:hypothetical protein
LEKEEADEVWEESSELRLSGMMQVKDNMDLVKEWSEEVRIGLEDELNRRSCISPISF